MGRQLIHPYIDHVDFIKLKAKNINISELVRNLLKQYLNTSDEFFDEEMNVIEELEKEKEKIEIANNKVAELSTKLMVISDRKKKDFQRSLDAEMRINQGLKESGFNPLDQ